MVKSSAGAAPQGVSELSGSTNRNPGKLEDITNTASPFSLTEDDGVKDDDLVRPTEYPTAGPDTAYTASTSSHKARIGSDESTDGAEQVASTDDGVLTQDDGVSNKDDDLVRPTEYPTSMPTTTTDDDSAL